MALDDYPLQAKQSGAIVSPVIDMLLEVIQDGQGNQGDKFGEQTAVELPLQKSSQHLCQTFRGLEGDVANEAIANNNFSLTLVDTIPLNISHKIQAGLPEQLGRSLNDVVSFDSFRANIENADRWPVSYTHLDVYKRQHRYARRCPGEPQVQHP